MKLISVNVSLPKEIPHNGKIVKTSIFKEPVSGRVMVRRLNVDGDDQADRRYTAWVSRWRSTSIPWSTTRFGKKS
jgi:MOSC domain-containing protein YiiM